MKNEEYIQGSNSTVPPLAIKLAHKYKTHKFETIEPITRYNRYASVICTDYEV